MAANTITTRYGSKGAKQVMSEADRLKAKIAGLQKQGAKGLVIGAGAGATIAAMNLVGSAIRGVTDYLGDSAEAYREDIKSQAQLRTSLAANDTAYRGNARAIEDVLEKRIDLGFSDDEQRSSLAALTAITKDGTKALEIQRTAMDLARLKGMDLATATELLGKVAGGNVSILRRYGIVIEKGATSTEALAKVHEMAAGQAEAWADSIGKTEVAQIKAAEASEKFGKQVDRIQGMVMPLATGAIEGFANAIDALAITLDGTAPKTAKLDAQVSALETSFLNAIPGVDDLIGKMRLFADAQLDAEAAADTHGDALIGVRQAAEDLPGPLGDTEDAVRDLTDAERANIEKNKRVAETLERIQDVAETLPDKLDDLTEALFGSAQLTGDIAETRGELAALLDEEPKKGTRAWKIWAGDVAAARQRLFELQFQQKQTEGPEALDEWLRKQRDALGKTDKEARDYYNTLIAINSINLKNPIAQAISRIASGRYSGKSIPGAAEGGIVKARPGGTLVNVGEGGKDEAIVPLGKGMGGGTTSLTVNFNTNWAPSVMQAREAANTVARELQRMGLIARGGAF